MNRSEYIRKRRLQGATSRIRKENARLNRTEIRLQRLKTNFELRQRQHTKSVDRELDQIRKIKERIDLLESNMRQL